MFIVIDHVPLSWEDHKKPKSDSFATCTWYNKDIENASTAKISELLSKKEINAEVVIIFQTIENLHKACPQNLGDWYFTGNYPTDGGNRVVNQAFINFYEGKNERAY